MNLLYPFLDIGMPLDYVLAVILMLIVVCFYSWHKNKCKAWYFNILLLAYILLVLGKTVLFREVSAEVEANTYPFWSYIEGFSSRRYILVQILLNILMFIPIGLLGSDALKTNRFLKVTLFGLVLSLTIELLQLVFRRGLFEFDDIFHNTLGCIIGFYIYKIAERFFITHALNNELKE